VEEKKFLRSGQRKGLTVRVRRKNTGSTDEEKPKRGGACSALQKLSR
jgi:hypothetical protein